MSKDIDVALYRVVIPGEQVFDCLAALNAFLHGTANNATLIGDFSGVPYRTVQEALEAFGVRTVTSWDVQLVAADLDALYVGQFEALLEIIAPHVRSEACIDAIAEDFQQWRYTFNEGRVHKHYAHVTWEDQEHLAVRLRQALDRFERMLIETGHESDETRQAYHDASALLI